MAGGSFASHLRNTARVTLDCLGSETVEYVPEGIEGNKRSIVVAVDRRQPEGKDRSRELTWTVHAEDHATRGIDTPKTTDLLRIPVIADDVATQEMRIAKVETDSGHGIITVQAVL